MLINNSLFKTHKQEIMINKYEGEWSINNNKLLWKFNNVMVEI